mgnify:FL=1
MIPYYYLWLATKRLEQSKETLSMMGENANGMLQAQHEMIEREVEYWTEQSNKFTIILLTLVMGCVIMVTLQMKGLL